MVFMYASNIWYILLSQLLRISYETISSGMGIFASINNWCRVVSCMCHKYEG